MALPFTVSADFAVSKPAGTACANLDADFRCGIHAGLRERGFTGCTVFDCFGAGQRVSRETFGGRDWRSAPGTAASMFAAFGVVRQLHELLWYLGESLARPAARKLARELRATSERVEALAGGGPSELAAVDVPALRAEVGELLGRVSESVRAGVPGRRPDRRSADLAGARLRGADLRGASLRGALLIAAELSGADLRSADLLGADLRNAELAGADLREALFLTQAQVNAARGDAATRLPEGLRRPSHWSGPQG
ncbi:pentapeptide repeat-containing protein [Streptomyces mayteni]